MITVAHNRNVVVDRSEVSLVLKDAASVGDQLVSDRHTYSKRRKGAFFARVWIMYHKISALVQRFQSSWQPDMLVLVCLYGAEATIFRLFMKTTSCSAGVSPSTCPYSSTLNKVNIMIKNPLHHHFHVMSKPSR